MTIKQFIGLDGSNAKNMIDFANTFSNVKQIRLERNFRSTNEIVQLADNVIKNNKVRLPKKMTSTIHISDAKIAFEDCFNEYEQYEKIAQEIVKLHKNGESYKEMAILVRKRKKIPNITLILNKYDIPFQSDSAEYFFNSKYYDKFIMTLDFMTNVDKNKLYECWKDCINIDKFNEGFKFLRRVVNSNGKGIENHLSNILIKFLDIVEFIKEDDEDYQLKYDSLQGIINIFNDFDEIYGDWQVTGRIIRLIEFIEDNVEELYKYNNFKSPELEDAVQILTIHKAKGLEYNSVFIPNLVNNEFPARRIYGKKYWHVLEGYFDDIQDKYETDIEDERKLFYVAVTRAKKNLFLLYDISKNEMSDFVNDAQESQ